MTRSSAPRWPQPHVRTRRSQDERTNLSSNELHHPATAELVSRMIEGFDPARLTRYPVQDAPAQAAAELFGRRPTEVLLAPGSDAVIRLLMLAARDTYGGRLILQDPNYEAWASCAEMIDGWSVQPVRKPRSDPAAWLDRIRESAESAEPSIVAVSWPNGPDGHLPSLERLTRLAASCRERGHLLVLDACYAAFSGHHDSIATMAGPGCLVMLSWSKAFGLAGGRLAVALGEPALVRFLRAYRQEDHVNVLMLHVLSQTREHLEQWRGVWAQIASSREGIREHLAALGVATPASGGNFLHLPCRDADASKRLAAELSERGFRVRDMGSIPGLEHHVRFTVACGPIRERFLATLEPLLDAVQGQAAT